MFLPRQCRRRAPHGGRGLDAVATLAGTPEKAFDLRVEAHDRNSIGRKRPQPSPTVIDPSHVDFERRLHAIDTDCDIQVFRLRIAGGLGYLVGRRQEKLGGVGLEIEFLVGIDDRGPAPNIHPGGCINQKRSAPQRLQPDAARTARFGEFIRPRPGGIHHNRCTDSPALEFKDPGAVSPLDVHDLVSGHERGTRGSRTPKEPLVQRVDIDIHGIGIQGRRCEIPCAQKGHSSHGLLDAEQGERAPRRANRIDNQLQSTELIGSCDV